MKMKLNKIVLRNVLVLAFFIVAVSTYIGYKSQPIVLEFGMFTGSNWDVENSNSYVIIDKAIEQFEKNHKNVKIHYYSGIMKEDYSEWFSRQLLLGKAPDVFMILTDDFNQFASIDVLKNLDELIQEDDGFNEEAFYESALNTGKYHGRQYALPYETVPTLMFVNRTLLEQEGIIVPGNDWSWNDLYEIAEKVTKDTDGDGVIDQFGTFNYDWMEAVYTNGTALFDMDGTKANLTDIKVVEAVKFAKKIYELNQGQKVTQLEFDSGEVAFMPLLYSDYRTYRTYPYKLKKYTKFEWDCITLPAGEGGGNISEVNTLLMGINKRTKQEALAWEFLKILTYEEEIQMDIFRYSQGASVLKNVTRSEEAEIILREDVEVSEKVIDNELLSQVIEQGTTAPKFQKYFETMELTNNEIKKIIEGDKNVDSTLKILQRKINRFLEQ